MQCLSSKWIRILTSKCSQWMYWRDKLTYNLLNMHQSWHHPHRHCIALHCNVFLDVTLWVTVKTVSSLRLMGSEQMPTLASKSCSSLWTLPSGFLGRAAHCSRSRTMFLTQKLMPLHCYSFDIVFLCNSHLTIGNPWEPCLIKSGSVHWDLGTWRIQYWQTQ